MGHKVNFKKIDVKEVRNMFRIIPKVLAQNAFTCFLLLFAFSLAFSVVVFYKYTFPVVERKEDSQSLKIKKGLLESILESIKEDKERFDRIDEKEYIDIFAVPGTQNIEGIGER